MKNIPPEFQGLASSALAGAGAAPTSTGQDAGKPCREVSNQQPLLHLCKVIDSSAPEIKSVLAEKLKEKLTVDEKTFYGIPMDIYKTISDETRSKYTEAIDRIFNADGQIGDNLRIAMLIQAKNNYMKTAKDKNIFTMNFNNYEEFNTELNEQIDKDLEVNREAYNANIPTQAGTQKGGNLFKNAKDAINGQLNPLGPMANNMLGNVANSVMGKKPPTQGAAGETGGASKELEITFDKVYRHGDFKRKTTKILLNKVLNIVKSDNKNDQINILLEAASKKVFDEFDKQLGKFIQNIDNQYFNLCIISAIGPRYIHEYFSLKGSNPGQNIGQYIDSLIMSKEGSADLLDEAGGSTAVPDTTREVDQSPVTLSKQDKGSPKEEKPNEPNQTDLPTKGFSDMASELMQKLNPEIFNNLIKDTNIQSVLAENKDLADMASALTKNPSLENIMKFLNDSRLKDRIPPELANMASGLMQKPEITNNPSSVNIEELLNTPEIQKIINEKPELGQIVTGLMQDPEIKELIANPTNIKNLIANPKNILNLFKKQEIQNIIDNPKLISDLLDIPVIKEKIPGIANIKKIIEDNPKLIATAKTIAKTASSLVSKIPGLNKGLNNVLDNITQKGGKRIKPHKTKKQSKTRKTKKQSKIRRRRTNKKTK